MTDSARDTASGLDPRLGRLVGRVRRIGSQISHQVQEHFGDEIGELRDSGRGMLRRLGRTSSQLTERLLATDDGAWPKQVRRALEHVGTTLERWTAAGAGGAASEAGGARAADSRARRGQGGRPRRRRRPTAAKAKEREGAAGKPRAEAPAPEGES